MPIPSIFSPPSLAPVAQRSSPGTSMLARLLALPKARPRVAHLAGDIAMVELRGVTVAALPRLRDELLAQAMITLGVQSAEVHPFLRRVQFRITPGRVDLQALCALVEAAEQSCSEPGTPLSTERQLPDDEVLRIQRWVELLADSAGLGVGLLLRFVPFVPTGIATNVGVALMLVRTHDRLRAPLDRKLGKDRADLLLSLMLASTQGMARRPLSSLIDVGYRVSALREHKARSRLYERLRGELLQAPLAEVHTNELRVHRPVPVPDGPLERYEGRAWLTAAGAFGVGFVTSRSLRRAGAALFGALPKPAHLGREIYANEVSRALSDRGSLVLTPDALRRLDRVDCLVIDASLLSHARFSIGAVHLRSEPVIDHLHAKIAGLFDARRPTELRHGGGYALGPLPLMSVELDDEAHEVAHTFSARGSLVLGLTCGERLCALVELRISGRRGVEDLVDAAHVGGLRVLIAQEHGPSYAYLGSHPVEVMDGGEDLPAGIRRLQQQGRVVCYVALGQTAGLAHADCAIGVRDPEMPTPWAAHVICEPDLEGLHTLIRACLLARTVSKQSVNLALGAAAVGALASSGAKGGPSQRVMLVVNMAALIAMLNALRQSAPLRGHDDAPTYDATPWHALETRAVLHHLHSASTGLSDAQVAAHNAARQLQHEPSAISELGQAIAQELLNPLAPLLAAGAGLSALVGSTLDAGIVAGVGGVNAVVGGVQRFRTERAIRRLVQPVRQQVRVRREGATRVLPAEELVPGDIMLLVPGESLPADCRILECNALEVDTSILTGESLPSVRDAVPSFEGHLADRSCMLYAGTRVVAGTATAVVVATGKNVESQRHAQAKDLAQSDSGVQVRLKELMRLTGPIAAAGGVAVMATGLLRGRTTSELVESGVSMAVAAIPEGLPLLASAAQLSAAERLSQRGALVRNARSIEALGRVDVICLDKTGTLTTGQLELQSVCDTSHEQSPTQLDAALRNVLAAAMRATAIGTAIHSDPTDAALGRAAEGAGVERSEGHPGLRPQTEHPFESARGYHAVLSRTDSGLLLSMKGAPERMILRCRDQLIGGLCRPLSESARTALVARAAQLAAQGLRVMAVAESTLDGAQLRVSLAPPALDVAGRRLLGSEELCFLGFLAFRDPAREEAARTLTRLRGADIQVVMLTGDHVNTATRIANDIGLLAGRQAITGIELSELSDDELFECVERYGVFARVTPGQKVRVVRALQRRRRTVAMIGDGANDAPALRVAEVGVAVGQQCAPSARAVADIVLTDNSIERVLDCILEARAMWLSVRDAVSILVGGNLGEIGFTVAAGVIAGRPPLSPRQLLLVNFMTDIAPAMAIALRTPTQSVYERMLVGRPEELMQAGLNRAIAIRAVSTGLGATWAWTLGSMTGSKARASTVALAALVGSQLGQAMLSRDAGRRVMITALGSAAVLTGIVQTPGLSHLFGCRPLGPLGWTFALGSSVAATGTSVLLTNIEERVRAAWAARAAPMRAEVQVHHPAPRPRVLKLTNADS